MKGFPARIFREIFYISNLKAVSSLLLPTVNFTFSYFLDIVEKTKFACFHVAIETVLLFSVYSFVHSISLFFIFVKAN